MDPAGAATASIAALIQQFFSALQNFAWEFGVRHEAYVYRLDTNLKELKEAVEELRAHKVSVIKRIIVEEGRKTTMKRSEGVRLWIKRVDENTGIGKELLQEGEVHLDRRCLGGICSVTFWKTSCYGGKVAACLDELGKLRTYDLTVVVEEVPAEPDYIEIYYRGEQCSVRTSSLKRRDHQDYGDRKEAKSITRRRPHAPSGKSRRDNIADDDKQQDPTACDRLTRSMSCSFYQDAPRASIRFYDDTNLNNFQDQKRVIKFQEYLSAILFEKKLERMRMEEQEFIRLVKEQEKLRRMEMEQEELKRLEMEQGKLKGSQLEVVRIDVC